QATLSGIGGPDKDSIPRRRTRPFRARRDRPGRGAAVEAVRQQSAEAVAGRPSPLGIAEGRGTIVCTRSPSRPQRVRACGTSSVVSWGGRSVLSSPIPTGPVPPAHENRDRQRHRAGPRGVAPGGAVVDGARGRLEGVRGRRGDREGAAGPAG